MELPGKLIIESLKGFCVCHFKDTNHSPEAPPHFYVTVPVTDESSLLLSIITSQIENKKRYYNRANKIALSSLVPVNSRVLPFFSKPSIIDCNQAELISKGELPKRIDPEIKIDIRAREIPQSLKREIVAAIKSSPIVKPYVKKLIKYP